MDPGTARRIEHYAEIIGEHLPEEADEARLALAALVGVTRELDEQATTDTLTGLPNRRALFQRDLSDRRAESTGQLVGEFRESEPRPPVAWAAIYADLDKFKQVNDVLGHHFGDRVLQCTASVLRRNIRKQDEAYRVGGDEFIIFMPLQTRLETEQLGYWMKGRFDEGLERLREGDDQDILPEGMQLGGEDIAALETISASFGVFLSEGPSVDRASMLQAAEPVMRAEKDTRSER